MDHAKLHDHVILHDPVFESSHRTFQVQIHSQGHVSQVLLENCIGCFKHNEIGNRWGRDMKSNFQWSRRGLNFHSIPNESPCVDPINPICQSHFT